MKATANRRLTLYAGTAHPCAYLRQRQSVMHYVDPYAAMDPALFGALLTLGFRRSGGHLYRPGCPSCRRCVPARIPTGSFAPDRSQRRAARRNHDLALQAGPGAISEEHFRLYRRYVSERHADGGMANPDRESCRSFLLADWCDTLFLDLRLDGRLVATAVTDVVPEGLSAIYTFFDPDLAPRSLGTYALLCQIRHARELGLPYLYLGYWVPGSRKMQYKERFRPLELYIDGQWEHQGPGAPLPVPN